MKYNVFVRTKQKRCPYSTLGWKWVICFIYLQWYYSYALQVSLVNNILFMTRKKLKEWLTHFFDFFKDYSGRMTFIAIILFKRHKDFISWAGWIVAVIIRSYRFVTITKTAMVVVICVFPFALYANPHSTPSFHYVVTDCANNL